MIKVQVTAHFINEAGTHSFEEMLAFGTLLGHCAARGHMCERHRRLDWTINGTRWKVITVHLPTLFSATIVSFLISFFLFIMDSL
jgi:hypothetical protein